MGDRLAIGMCLYLVEGAGERTPYEGAPGRVVVCEARALKEVLDEMHLGHPHAGRFFGEPGAFVESRAN